jgi:hypothetical protein
MKTQNPTVAALRSMVKKCSRYYVRYYVHAEKDTQAPDYQRDRAIFRITGVQKIGEKEVITRVDVKGWIKAGYTNKTETHVNRWDSIAPYRTYETYSEAYAPEKGFWSLWNDTVFKSVVESLPRDTEPEMRVELDAGTNQVLTDVRLHSDKLSFTSHIKRGNSEFLREFLLDVETGRHNSARFGSPRVDNEN